MVLEKKLCWLVCQIFGKIFYQFIGPSRVAIVISKDTIRTIQYHLIMLHGKVGRAEHQFLFEREWICFQTDTIRQHIG